MENLNKLSYFFEAMKGKRQHKISPYYFIFAKKIKRLEDERMSWWVRCSSWNWHRQMETCRVRLSHLQASDGYAAEALCNSLLSQCVWIPPSLLGSLNYSWSLVGHGTKFVNFVWPYFVQGNIMWYQSVFSSHGILLKLCSHLNLFGPIVYGNWSSNVSLESLCAGYPKRVYHTCFCFWFLMLKSIPNSPTECSESHLSSFRRKWLQNQRCLFEPQLNHILILGQITSLSLSSVSFLHLWNKNNTSLIGPCKTTMKSYLRNIPA